MKYKKVINHLEELNENLDDNLLHVQRATKRLGVVVYKLAERRAELAETMSRIASKYVMQPDDIDEMNDALMLLDNATAEIGETVVDSNDAFNKTLTSYHNFLQSLRPD